MILRIDHIALAVRNYDKAFAFFTTLFGAVPGSYADDSSMKYLWQNMAMGDLSRLELLTPTGRGSFLDGFLSSREGGVHHMTLQTPDIYLARKTLEDKGIPYFGFNDYGPFWKELFIHPRDAFGVLIQIAEFNADDWISSKVKMIPGKRWVIEKNGEGINMTLAHPGGGKVTLELSKDEAEKLAADLRNTL